MTAIKKSTPLFFFQAEDGIRDGHVTGVQTCALPIYGGARGSRRTLTAPRRRGPANRLVADATLPAQSGRGDDVGHDPANGLVADARLPVMNGWQDRGERLLEAGLALSSEFSLPAILQRIVDLGAELTGARYGALGVLGADGTITEFITTGLTGEERAAIGPLPVGRGILGVLIHDARPLRLRNIADDPRSVGFPPNHPPMG